MVNEAMSNHEKESLERDSKDQDSVRTGHTLAESLLAVAGGVVVAVILVSGLSATVNKSENSLSKITEQASPDVLEMSELVGSSLQCDAKDAGSLQCLIKPTNNSCSIGQGELCEADLEIARIAWKYFENNYNPETGLVNSVNNYPSTTMWDTGSALAATVSAYDFGFISKKEFDDRITAMTRSLLKMKLFNNEAPNKAYHTKTLDMVNYANKPTDVGIGTSVLDLARLMSWSKMLGCMHPKYSASIGNALSRWKYERLVKNGNLYGLANDKKNEGKTRVLQEGRLGYEQYAGKIFEEFGFDVSVAASYENKWRGNVDILGVPIAYDTRDPREYGANNYVVTESYAMDAMELGLDNENTELLRNIFEVQKRRWKETGQVTAISEDNIDQAPWFVYNTIFNAGQAWQTMNNADVVYNKLKTISVKAAMSMALLFPDDEYSAVLMNAIESAYHPDKGWYSGIYESGEGYNKATTANTNGVIMSGILYKKYGSLFPHCNECGTDVAIDSDVIKLASEAKSSECEICALPE